MSQHKIENKKLSIEIFGVNYPVRKPKIKDIVEFDEATEKMSNKEKLVFVQGRLVAYGIPQDVLDELDYDAYIELIEVVHGSKKN